MRLLAANFRRRYFAGFTLLLFLGAMFSGAPAWTRQSFDTIDEIMSKQPQLIPILGWKPFSNTLNAVFVGKYTTIWPQGYFDLRKTDGGGRPGVQEVINKPLEKESLVSFVFYANPLEQQDASLRVTIRKAKKPQTVLYSQVEPIRHEEQSEGGWTSHRMQFKLPKAQSGELAIEVELGPTAKFCQFGSCWLYVVSAQDPITVGKYSAPVVVKRPIIVDPEISEDAISKRIEKIRKRRLAFVVRDHNGAAIGGALIKVRQTRHAFKFGCAIASSESLYLQARQNANANSLFSLFNLVLLENNWSELEKSKGVYDFKDVDQIVNSLTQHHTSCIITPWSLGQTLPAWLPDGKGNIGSAVRSYVSNSISHFADRVNNFQFALDLKPPIGRWVELTTPTQASEKLLTWSRVAESSSRKVNVILRLDSVQGLGEVVRWLSRSDNLPGGISTALPLLTKSGNSVDNWQALKSLNSLGPEIYVRGFIKMPPKENDLNEKDLESLKRSYALLFSHPKVKGIIFPDPFEAPQLVKDGVVTTATYKSLNNLIHGTWWTVTDCKSDSDGKAAIKAFLGDYEITVDDGKGHVKKVNVELKSQSADLNEIQIRF